MRKDIITTAVISAVVASAVTAFASGPGEPFPDVAEDAYYYNAVHNMRNLGVMNGYDDGNFGPDDYVTRGQLATTLERYDEALINPPWPYASGMYPLMNVLCFGGIDFEFDNESVEDDYNEICDMP